MVEDDRAAGSSTPAFPRANDGAERQLLDQYATLLTIRRAEERLSALFAQGEVPGFIHLSIGQEAVSAGVMSALGPTDTIASTHRGHGHAIAKGLDVSRFFLEILGAERGLLRRPRRLDACGRHVGRHARRERHRRRRPVRSRRQRARASVAQNRRHRLVFFGDGALAEGVLHESLNLAALWSLRSLFVCENNGWSEFSPASRQLATEPSKLAAAFGFRHERVDGNDVVAVAHAWRVSAIEAVRAGGGPRLIECKTTRVRGHFEGDPQKYRDRRRIRRCRAQRDPLKRAARRTARNGCCGGRHRRGR